jgi:hypothetical protein
MIGIELYMYQNEPEMTAEAIQTQLIGFLLQSEGDCEHQSFDVIAESLCNIYKALCESEGNECLVFYSGQDAEDAYRESYVKGFMAGIKTEASKSEENKQRCLITAEESCMPHDYIYNIGESKVMPHVVAKKIAQFDGYKTAQMTLQWYEHNREQVSA